MEIEWLRFKVDTNLRERFVQVDEEVWTATLSKYSGFLGKEVWISPDDLTEVVAVIHWETMEQWQAIPASELQATEARMQAAMEGHYTLEESRRYQMRKFLQS